MNLGKKEMIKWYGQYLGNQLNKENESDRGVSNKSSI